MIRFLLILSFCFSCSFVCSQEFTVTIDGTDAIFLAGRTDVVIPDPSLPWTGPGTFLMRHSAPTPEELQETLPPMLDVAAGDIIRVLDPAVGGINFFNGFGPPLATFGPSGNSLSGSSLLSLDGISGYQGPQGPLAGVFLNDSIPSSGPAPLTLDFGPSGLTVDFESLSPELGQVFYIGDGVTSEGVVQSFNTPTGATRLFFGVPDGFSFGGAPGAYDDNDGQYLVRVGINVDPTLKPGDFDVDGDVDADDIDFYSEILGQVAIGQMTRLDLNESGVITIEDHDYHVTNLVETSNGEVGALLGDINLDGSVDVLGDAFVLVSSLDSDKSGWSNGDLNADGTVDVLGDAFRLVANLGMNNSSSGTVFGSAVPEPGGWALLTLLGLADGLRRHKR